MGACESPFRRSEYPAARFNLRVGPRAKLRRRCVQRFAVGYDVFAARDTFGDRVVDPLAVVQRVLVVVQVEHPIRARGEIVNRHVRKAAQRVVTERTQGEHALKC